MIISAGILIYRFRAGKLEIFLVHPGGPFWQNKDEGIWSIPKGETKDKDGELFQTALRELEEETGIDLSTQPRESFLELGSVIYKNSKKIFAWAIEHDLPPNFKLRSNDFELELQGKKYQFPEIDRGEFFPVEIAEKKIHPVQKELIERLKRAITNL